MLSKELLSPVQNVVKSSLLRWRDVIFVIEPAKKRKCVCVMVVMSHCVHIFSHRN